MNNTPFERTWDYLAHDGVVRWFGKRRDGIRIGGAATSPADLDRLRYTSARGTNVYVHLNPAVGFRGMRPSVPDITHFRGVLLDIDPNPGVGPYVTAAMRHALIQLGAALGVSLAPILVDSGRGEQAWLVDNPFVPEEPEWRQRVRRSWSYLLDQLDLPEGAHADPSTCDVARVVRLPGTHNSKTGRTAAFIHEYEPMAVPGLYDRLVAFDPGEGASPDEALVAAPGSVDSYVDVWTRLTGEAQGFITKGRRYPGRHTALWHTADLLHREGLSREALHRALLLGAEACRPKLNNEDVLYAIRRAHEKKTA
jgi:hypothetical protein